MKRRGQSEQNCCSNRSQDCKGQDGSVGRESSRKPIGKEAGGEVHSESSESKPEGTTGQRKEETFGQQLSQQASPGSPERSSNSDFLFVMNVEVSPGSQPPPEVRNIK